MTSETLDQIQASPDQEALVDAPPPIPEQAADTKVVTFRDERGIERSPNPVAAECYASPDIQQAVGEHFLWVDQGLEDVETKVTQLTETEAAGERPKPFDPLTDELLETVLAAATSQLPGLTRTITRTVERQATTGRIFKRKYIASKEVVEKQAVPGYTSTAEDQDTGHHWRQALGGIARSEYGTKPEDVPAVEQRVQQELVSILTGTEPTQSERRDHFRETKLPLLATKLRDSGLSAEQIAGLSWDDIAKLVPEVSEMFTDIQTGVEYQSAMAIFNELNTLENDLRAISPVCCDTIAQLYYSDELLEKMTAIQRQIEQLKEAPYKTLYPDSEPFEPVDFIAEQHESMASFFKFKDIADTLFIHGTAYAPRVIKAGALKPPHKMARGEFTFMTDHGPGSVAGLEGARAVHWAAALGGTSYGYDDSPAVLMSRLEQSLARRGGTAFAKEELAKGGLGMGRFAMRLGDLVTVTPYGGSRLASSDSLRNKRETPKNRLGVVELTPRGWEQVASQVRQGQNEYDIVFVAAPEHRDLDELYDYEYPIESMIIGIPSRDPETIKQALREHGWSEEQIAAQTREFTDGSASQEALQAEALTRPKFPRGVVVPIRKDL